MILNKIWIVSLIAIYLSTAEGSRILVSAPYGTKSYHNMYVPLVTELARRGHHITVITNYKSIDLEKTENVNQIVMDKLIVDLSPYPNAFETLHSPSLMFKAMRIGFKSLFDLPRIVAETMYEDERVLNLMANDQFDLVMVGITSNPGSYPLAWHFKAPMIMLTPNAIFPGVMASLGDDEQPSYVPFFMSNLSDKMNLLQRTLNTVLTNIFAYFIHQYHFSTIHSIVQQRAIPDCPSLYEIEKNISLIFVNTHPAINYPRAMPPQVVEVGGIHCRPGKPLPDDLEAFVSHPDGFILFAVGSMIPMEGMPDRLINSFTQTFARLPQRVVWQWKGKVRPDLPKNVLAIPWLPQQDLLGHKNCKLFMTHGGLNSMQEAIYHRVPVLGLPFGTDQRLNMRRAIETGYARQLFWTELNQESLTDAIQDLIHNSSYIDTVQKRSELYHDQFETPIERAVYWTEYAIRHNGTEHLKLSSRHLTSYQRALIDVYLVLTLSGVLPFLLIVICLKKCCRRKGKFVTSSGKKNK